MPRFLRVPGTSWPSPRNSNLPWHHFLSPIFFKGLICVKKKWSKVRNLYRKKPWPSIRIGNKRFKATTDRLHKTLGSAPETEKCMFLAYKMLKHPYKILSIIQTNYLNMMARQGLKSDVADTIAANPSIFWWQTKQLLLWPAHRKPMLWVLLSSATRRWWT